MCEGAGRVAGRGAGGRKTRIWFMVRFQCVRVVVMAFKYDIVTLIELVEARPCLWDKTNEASKNKILREKCWQEVFAFLETGYTEMSKFEKKKTGKLSYCFY